ncbi:alpha/beta fold hydrolase [Pseudoduganella umbonata]|uniref:Alpha/beta hydrolase n=1 Tax=Pseudoduganella umbonata TaxID=864828 RepID=A0A4P8HVQ7_9BURK|nr:alpha/beta hydrolase [Pseudoduganella umbonata]MBB3223674.1 pimeloyl-ACP methyl ester carboxylesterase [Pseudoduganella umbonata]QCP13466.1 alpha/beta hydrolase [Pseudoduganella umbonata]
MYISVLPFLLGTLAGVISLALLAGGVYIVWAWYVGTLATMGWLWSGIAMLAWSLLGRQLVLALYPRGPDEPRSERSPNSRKVQGVDGSALHVEFDGPEGKPVIVMTHGWALDSTAWYYVRKELSKDFRLVLWDLPGLGLSSQPADRRYSVERLAEDLHRVIGETGYASVTLVGHSIGGMMMLTLARLRPDLFREKVNGMVLMDTTHTWPLNTVMAGTLLKFLRWPLIEPLLLLTILLSPLVRLMNLQSYLNGTSHIVNRITSLSRGVTRGQLDFGSRFNVKDTPSVIAKGLRAVMRWDETDTPAILPVPVRVIVGDADRLTKPEAAVAITAKAPRADLVTISPAGHNGLLEEGRQYGKAIAEFVGKLQDLQKTGISEQAQKVAELRHPGRGRNR